MTRDEAVETDRLITHHHPLPAAGYARPSGVESTGYAVDYGKKSLGYEKGYLYQLADGRNQFQFDILKSLQLQTLHRQKVSCAP